MRVNDQNLNGTAASQTGAAPDVQRADRGGSARTAGAGAGSDRIELSTTLGTLSRVLAAHSSGRGARVSELAAQFGRGEYRPDSAATSRAMLTEALASGG